MKWLLAVALLLGLTGCEVSKQTTQWETGPGVVRTIDWYHRTFIFELQNRQLKAFHSICHPEVLPVWEGLNANIKFHWVGEEGGYPNYNCYAIDSVERL